MAPEQSSGVIDQVDARSDVFSLGMTLPALVAPLSRPETATGNLAQGGCA